MRVLLLVTSFNSLTQAVFTRLRDRGVDVGVAYAIDEAQMLAEIEAFKPDLLLSPFLKRYLPPSIYEKYDTFVFHPGPRGDRGPNALEYALLNPKKEWGVTILKATEIYDGGDIYAEASFEVRECYKASLYRQEVVDAALTALDEFFVNYEAKRSTSQLLNPMHQKFTQKMRSIDWQNDTTQEIIDKIYLADSHPGVLDEILGVPCYLYGAHKEDKFRGRPKEILAKRDGAICLGTVDGALWISHLKERGKFKLPATYVLKSRLKGVKEDRLPLIFDRSYETFHEVWMERKEEVAYLHFNFHNGAMSTAQCIRLKYAIEYLSTQSDVEVLVLMGGEDFFSNGIHLNILEDSQKKGEDGWANINAMNDLIRSILFATEVVTIASFCRNAGAGGVFLGLACDFVVAREGVVFNPHYKTLGLSGSEYHTWTLPKRVGEKKAKELLDTCLPISSTYAKKIGMIDAVFANESYFEHLHSFAKEKMDDEFLWEKEEMLEENEERMEACKEREITRMHPEFWDEKSEFHRLRREFVYKVCPTKTPDRFRILGESDA